MADKINYSSLMRHIDEWARSGGKPQTGEELALAGWDKQQVRIAEYCGSVELDQDDNLYHLRSTELIGPLLGGDMRRAERIVSDLMQTMRKNHEQPEHIERTCIVQGVDPDKVPELRQHCARVFGEALVKLDALLMDAYKDDDTGVRFGLSLFQFDSLD